MTKGAAIFGVAGPDLRPDEHAFFREYDPVGFILFARNVESPTQIQRLTSDLRQCVGRDAPILIDQEGGRVARLGAPYWREWLPPLEHAEGTKDAERALYLRYRIIAEELRALGITVNCAPCADIAYDQTHPFLQNRCLGRRADQVISRGRAVAKGLLDGGVLPVLKHIPGHGRAQSDSHKELPFVDASQRDLLESDFKVFKALHDIPMGMTAHVVYRGMHQTLPATTSHEMISVIRDELGFQGLLMTDDLSMNALRGTVVERTVGALAAGVDVILHCNGNLAEMRDVAEAAEGLTDIADRRFQRAMDHLSLSEFSDISAMEAELQNLYTA